MNRFRYAADPLCVLAMLAYLLNRLVLKPRLPWPFLQGQFNDLLLVPAALPWVLWLHRRFGWRARDDFPSGQEIGFYLIVWAVVCEGLGPALLGRGTSDWRDVLAYAAGAGAAGLWWRLAEKGGQWRQTAG